MLWHVHRMNYLRVKRKKKKKMMMMMMTKKRKRRKKMKWRDMAANQPRDRAVTL